MSKEERRQALRSTKGKKFFVALICYDANAEYMRGVELINNWRSEKAKMIENALREVGIYVKKIEVWT